MSEFDAHREVDLLGRMAAAFARREGHPDPRMMAREVTRYIESLERMNATLVSAGNRMEHILSHSAGANGVVQEWRNAAREATRDE